MKYKPYTLTVDHGGTPTTYQIIREVEHPMGRNPSAVWLLFINGVEVDFFERRKDAVAEIERHRSQPIGTTTI